MALRVRNKPGSTKQARQHFHKCSRIGNILKVTAERYVGHYNSSDKSHRYPITQEVIRVTGTHGTVRLFGLCWGYGGEGPHALRDLLMFLGLKAGHAGLVAFQMPRRGHSELGVDWTLEFNAGNPGNGATHGYVVVTPAEGEKKGWQRSEAMTELPPVQLLART
jgi:hypothetical protein